MNDQIVRRAPEGLFGWRIGSYASWPFYDLVLLMCQEYDPEIKQRIESDEELEMLAYCGGMYIPMESILAFFESTGQFLEMVHDYDVVLDREIADPVANEYFRKLFRCVCRMVLDHTLDWEDSPNLSDIIE